MDTATEQDDHLTLKWGTLKSWRLSTPTGRALLEKYFALGSSGSAMLQNDTQEQKSLICQMIDECRAETIYLDWDGKEVSKEEAKSYVMDYGQKSPPPLPKEP